MKQRLLRNWPGSALQLLAWKITKRIHCSKPGSLNCPILKVLFVETYLNFLWILSSCLYSTVSLILECYRMVLYKNDLYSDFYGYHFITIVVSVSVCCYFLFVCVWVHGHTHTCTLDPPPPTVLVLITWNCFFFSFFLFFLNSSSSFFFSFFFFKNNRRKSSLISMTIVRTVVFWRIIFKMHY